MKLIISRKGLDSSAGGFPNPLLPGGIPLSLPIPDHHSPILYRDLWEGQYTDLIHDLGRGKIKSEDGAHLDPDLDEQAISRDREWRPLFGQAGAAASHLDKNSVGEGDLFLFYGWFREVEKTDGRWRYRKDAPDQHVLFGWFQVNDTVVPSGSNRHKSWMNYHPHFFGTRDKKNRIYVASRRLKLPGFDSNLPGAGVFQRIQSHHILTEPGRTRGHWLLPPWFHPDDRPSCLTYHQNPERWSRTSEGVQLQNVFRGQEFVLDCTHYPEAIDWANQLIQLSF